jgi:redox-sensing transcriptional repressor
LKKVSAKAIGRLSLYRFLLDNLRQEGVATVFSHELATAANCSPAQVRRDLMEINYTGSPVHGYQVALLIESIDNFLDDPRGRHVALIGVGNLGRALLAYFRGRRPKLTIVAAFDANETKTDRMINGCQVFPMGRLTEIIKEKRIHVAIIATPPSVAQQVAEQLIEAGVRGLLNFAPLRLRTPSNVYVEDADMTICLEKVAYFSRLRAEEQGER